MRSWPSKLDNTVAGGITSGETGFETIIRESFEEASLEEELVRTRIRATGLISYTHRSPEGWVQVS
jgi:8-oxo-dGTP pyrophosphatase MutT (NUDIX family)